MGGDDLDCLAAGAFDAGVGADEAYFGEVGTSGAGLTVVVDEPDGPLPGGVLKDGLFGVAGGEGAGGFVAGGGVVGYWLLVGLHC